MISLLQYISKKILPYQGAEKDNGFDTPNNNIDTIFSEIEEIKQENEKPSEPQLNIIDDERGCFTKMGTISMITNEYVLIENKYMCQIKYVIPQNLKVGEKVRYMAYKVDKSEELKIHKIIDRIEQVWETEPEETKQSEEILIINNNTFENVEPVNEQNSNTIQNIVSTDQILKKSQITKRTIIGKVDKRRGREIFLEDNTPINLDNVSSEFVPVVGDWVKLECIVEINENIPNLQGEILEIESIAPLRMCKKIGKVTKYDCNTEAGTIENSIVFIKAVCMTGYIPCIGDKVIVQSIESDQGISQNWRSLNVVPLEDLTTRFETSIVKFKPQLPTEEIEELIKDKESIEITKDINLCLDAKEEQEFEVVVSNCGNFKQKIIRCSFLSRKSESQLSLLSPTDNEPQHLRPSEQITYKFKCKARFVGISEEMIIFKFRQFKIGRIVTIKVNSINLIQQTQNGVSCTYNRNFQGSIIPEILEDGMYIRGVKPYKAAKFIVNRPTTWKIPDVLWETMNKIYIEKKTHSESEFLLTDRVPCLQEPLNFQNYKQRFDYLLYLEEIAQILDMQRFSIDSTVMHRSGEYLTLNVPGLAEKRPSLIIGDKVQISFKWDETNGLRNYEGYIHRIRSSDVYLKFNEKFHESYNNEDCQVKFKGSTTVLQRCHTALGVVINRLGADFLFPKKVVQKEPQYNFVEDEPEDEYDLKQKVPVISQSMTNEEKVKAIEAVMNKRTIKWLNKKLNIYQKTAVKNVLKGLARPLPYVIFGPPGTGKTITVCEAILQILFTISESRILVATPSNSSANLIAERLLDSKTLKPGDLVRLVAHHYLESESIPERLVQYCATADIAAEGSRSDVNQYDARGFQTNVTLSVICRHRIIVGTCSALGILYNMGCKPGHFTHIFIDEAGQASEPEIMIPLSLAHTSSTQVILAGDPKQLGPVNQSRLAGYFGLNDSFLVRLLQQFPYQRDPEGFESGYDPRLVTKLLMNYRSLPDLLDLPNKLFYESELIPQIDPEDSEEAELLESLSDMLPKRLGGPPAIAFHSVNGKNVQDPDSPSWYNVEEATQVYIYLMDLYNHGLQPNDIGIITPYSKQVFKIKSLLVDLDDQVGLPKVGSVEEFQGQERKVIILSTVRTAEDKVKEDIRHSLGFVAARERLNVAITRARTLLIIIGCPKLLQQDVYWRSVLEYCSRRSSCIGHDFTMVTK